MRSASRTALVVVLLGMALRLQAGELGLGELLEESSRELAETRDRLAADLQRAGIALPPAIAATVKTLTNRATTAADALAKRDDPDTLRHVRETWERLRSTRSVLRRVRHVRPEHAAVWPKMLDLAAKSIQARMSNRHVDATRLEAELDVMRMTLEHERAKRELKGRLAEILEFAAQHQRDPRVAEVVKELRARFVAMQEVHELRHKAECAARKLDAERHAVEAAREEHERLRDAAERRFGELERETERLMEHGERIIEEREDDKDDEDEDEDEDEGENEKPRGADF